MGPIDWTAIGVAVTVFLGWIGTLQKRINWLIGKMESVVPRTELDARFAAVDHRHQRELTRVERRVDAHYEKMDGKLDKIIDRLDQKADKE